MRAFDGHLTRRLAYLSLLLTIQRNETRFHFLFIKNFGIAFCSDKNILQFHLLSLSSFFQLNLFDIFKINFQSNVKNVIFLVVFYVENKTFHRIKLLIA